MAGTTDGRPFATLGPKGGRQLQKLTKYLHFADLDWVINTLLLKVFWKSRLTLLQALLDSWSSCRGDPPKQYQSQLKPLAQWLAVVSWADTACSCWWYFLIFCEFSAIFCRWTNSNLHSVAKHKHVRVCLHVSVSCSGQFSINTSSISDDFIALACANPTRTSQNRVLVSSVWCDFSSGCHYWFHASDQFLLSIFFRKARFCDGFKEIPNDCNGKFGTVCACCHVQKMLSTHMPVYVCHMFYSSLGWILVGVGWAPQKEVRWALGQRISPVVWITLSVERQKSCSCHVFDMTGHLMESSFGAGLVTQMLRKMFRTVKQLR